MRLFHLASVSVFLMSAHALIACSTEGDPTPLNNDSETPQGDGDQAPGDGDLGTGDGDQNTGDGDLGDGDLTTGDGDGVTTPDDMAPTAAVAAAAMGKGVNLGQVFDNIQHPRTLAAASAKIDAYYDAGFRNIRIPITWTEASDGDLLVNDPAIGDVNREHPRLAVIADVIDYALAKPGLYVVINTHHEETLKTESRSAVLERLWQDISDIFGDRSHHLIFEILNEPHRADTTPMPAADLRLMTGLAYAKIRAVDPKRLVIIGGNQWFGAHEVPAVWTSLDEVGGGQDPYVMATFHHYDPWTFCGDNQGDYADVWDDDAVRTPMETMQTWADGVGNGMPVYIGEWGVGWGSVLPTMDCNNVRHWYQKLGAEHAPAMNMPTAVWDDGGWFKIFDHGGNAFANNLVDCINGACAWTGEERYNAACLAP